MTAETEPKPLRAQARVDEHMHGERLDNALALLAPGSSLRRRRRLWLTHRVLVDGKERAKGFRVQAGQIMVLDPRAEPSAPVPLPGNPPYVIKSGGSFAALYKPAGLPTLALAGKPGPSLEQALPALLAPDAVLLNRLDTPTSGLVLAALCPEAEARYHAAQEEGRTRKVYAALVHGLVARDLLLQQGLGTDNRATVRVLDVAADPLRRTRVKVLHRFQAANLTLARAEITKGARHQIRAHLAHAGHPIVGDDRYGRDPAGGFLYLHHVYVEFPGFSALSLPEWPLPQALGA